MVLRIVLGLLLNRSIVQFNHVKHYVYTIQDRETVEEIQHCIEEMHFSDFRELSNQLVVEGDDEASIETLFLVQRAIGRLRGFQYTLHEKNGTRNVKLSMMVPDGDVGTVVHAHIADGSIYYDEERLSSAMFQDVVQAAVQHTGLPLRIYFWCQGNTLRDVFDATELLTSGLKIPCDYVRLVLLERELEGKPGDRLSDDEQRGQTLKGIGGTRGQAIRQ